MASAYTTSGAKSGSQVNMSDITSPLEPVLQHNVVQAAPAEEEDVETGPTSLSAQVKARADDVFKLDAMREERRSKLLQGIFSCSTIPLQNLPDSYADWQSDYPDHAHVIRRSFLQHGTVAVGVRINYNVATRRFFLSGPEWARMGEIVMSAAERARMEGLPAEEWKMHNVRLDICSDTVGLAQVFLQHPAEGIEWKMHVELLSHGDAPHLTLHRVLQRAMRLLVNTLNPLDSLTLATLDTVANRFVILPADETVSAKLFDP